jgi:SanA protein
MKNPFTSHRRTVLWRAFLVGCAAMALVFVLSNALVLARSRKHIVEPTSDVPAKYTALVLGARVYSGGAMSAMLADRLQTAVTLYREGTVERFLLSGDHGRTDYDEVNAMKVFLLREGVPPADIFLDHAGFDTYDSVYRAKAVFGVTDVLVVTQRFHLPRAVYAARALGLDAHGVVADRQRYAGELRNQLRESLARVKAVANVLLGAKPTFLGNSIPITGDSSKSWD